MARLRGISLSGSQLVASVLATLSAAIAASYLGVAGTLVGAAVGSVVSTVGNEVYKHYLIRSQERLKAAGVLIQHRTASHTRTGAQVTRTADMAQQARRGDRAAGAERTETLPGLGADWQAAQRPAGPDGATAAQRAAGEAGATAGQDQATGPGHWWEGISRRQWGMVGVIAAGIFLVVIAGITVFEVSVGKPLNASVWGRHATGTTVGNALTGHPSGRASPQPAGRSTAQPTTPGSSGSAGSSSPAVPSSPAPSGTSPSPVTSAPAPTPPSSAVPTTGSSAAPTAGAPGAGAQPGTGQNAGVARPAP